MEYKCTFSFYFFAGSVSPISYAARKKANAAACRQGSPSKKNFRKGKFIFTLWIWRR
jgi:hypothetical protein